MLRGKRALPWALAVLLALFAAALVRDHSREDSASADEPAHIQAAYLQWFRHTAITNIEHPPLAKEAAGFGLELFARPSAADVSSGVDFAGSGHDFLFHNHESPDRLLAAARAPMLLFFVGLILLVFAAANRLFGSGAGVFAALLTAFEPNLLAHAGIVHTDLPVCFFWLASVLAWGRVLSRRSPGRILFCGAALGCALSTKFSALYLFPTFGLIALTTRTMEIRSAEGARLPAFARTLVRDFGAAIGAGAVSVVVLLAVYQPAVSGMPVSEQQAMIDALVGRYQGAPGLAHAIEAVAPWSRGLAQFLGGVAYVERQDAAGRSLAFLNGELSLRGFPSYFFVAFAVKSTLPFLLVTLLSGFLMLTRRLDRIDALLWVPAAYAFVFSLGSSYNIGVRHILPVYPLLALAASRWIVEVPARFGRVSRGFVPVLALLLSAGQLATAAGAHPHELSYFNAFGGGTSGGYRVLCDSNSDWGLDLRRAVTELRRLGARDPAVWYFGGDDPVYRLSRPVTGTGSSAPSAYVAISTTLWDIGPSYYALNGRPDIGRQLASAILDARRRGRLAGRVGGSTLIFEIPPTGLR